VTTVPLPGGLRARLWSRGDDWVSNQVFWRGWDGYEPEMSRLFWRLATTASVTLDVGAHVGYYAILAGIANPAGSVYAFEPHPPVFERLQRNLALNRLRNVCAVKQAVGAADGSAPFFYVPGIVPCSSSLSAEFMSGAARLVSRQVTVVRLDAFARSHGLGGVDLVKLDTETTEADVLAGLGQLLAGGPDIFCEVLPQADGDALTRILEPACYSFYLLTEAGPQRRPRVISDRRWPNHLFTTREDSDIASLSAIQSTTEAERAVARRLLARLRGSGGVG
jgi:FkbM family methyltransferase